MSAPGTKGFVKCTVAGSFCRPHWYLKPGSVGTAQATFERQSTWKARMRCPAPPRPPPDRRAAPGRCRRDRRPAARGRRRRASRCDRVPVRRRRSPAPGRAPRRPRCARRSPGSVPGSRRRQPAPSPAAGFSVLSGSAAKASGGATAAASSAPAPQGRDGMRERCVDGRRSRRQTRIEAEWRDRRLSATVRALDFWSRALMAQTCHRLVCASVEVAGIMGCGQLPFGGADRGRVRLDSCVDDRRTGTPTPGRSPPRDPASGPRGEAEAVALRR